MRVIADVLANVLSYYLTVAIMGVGFGTMFGGKDGAAAAGHFFFVWPAQWAALHARTGGITLVVACSIFLLHRMVDPFILAIERGVLWLITRERGCARRR